MKSSIMVVDDQKVNRDILHELFTDEFDIIEACDGLEAIEKLGDKEISDSIAVVLLDIIMPKADGFTVLEYMQDNELIEKIPVILITGDSSTDVQSKGYDMGASEVITKPFKPYVIRKRVRNLIDLYFEKNHLKYLVDEQTEKIMDQKARIERMNYHVIDMMGSAVEFRSLETGMHVKRVRVFTEILLREYAAENIHSGITEKMIKNISYASSLHDIGKIAIPDSILLKPGKLTKDEFELMETHTKRGADIIQNLLDDDFDKDYRMYAYEIARSHHEKYDGKGYPDGLKGDEIPIWAQIVSIADCYDALMSDRVYKKAYSKEDSFKMILDGECGVFNPALIECFKLGRAELERKADEIE